MSESPEPTGQVIKLPGHEYLKRLPLEIHASGFITREQAEAASGSFTPVRKVKERPEPFLTVTFGWPYRVTAKRIDAAVEPYPGRWTHQVMIEIRWLDELARGKPMDKMLRRSGHVEVSKVRTCVRQTGSGSSRSSGI